MPFFVLQMKEKLNHLPTSPGCYLMLNAYGTVIYVGKAKNLKNRIKSYFTGAHNAKTQQLVAEIADFNYVITNSEQESLILEYNLIQSYKPRFNIRLIDDKSYAYLEITDEKDPRLIVSRYNQLNKNATLFGPFPNSYSAKQTMQLLHRLYPLRRCKKFKKNACLYYDIGQCLAPCIISNVDYQNHIKKITSFLKGDVKPVLKELEVKMVSAAESLNFELALEYKNLIANVNKTVEKQIIALNDFIDRDFIGYVMDENNLALVILNMRQGTIMDTHQVVFEYTNESDVISYIVSYYEKVLLPKEIYVSNPQLVNDLKVVLETNSISVPKIGDKKKLIDLCLANATEDLISYNKVKEVKNSKYLIGIGELEKLVSQKVEHLEIFDNAHLFGVSPVSGMVVFKDGEFVKKEYRKFNLTTTTNDDYQGFYEVIYRRYFKQAMADHPLPDLVLVDGAKGQVNAAKKALKDLNLDLKVLGLKKNLKHEISSLVIDNEDILLTVGTPLYWLLASFSEEVHRYTIATHRSDRNKKTYLSALNDIKGIGKQKKQLILSHFASLESIRAASVEDFRQLGLNDKLIKQIIEAVK